MKTIRTTLIAFLAAVITLTALAPCGIFAARAESAGVFSRFDELRSRFIAGDPDAEICELPEGGERAVLAFRQSVAPAAALKMLNKMGAFRPLAYTSQMVFAVGVTAEEAREICGGALLYCVPDEENDISLCSEDDIPYELGAIGVQPVNDGGRGVTVAVLDSGVDRTCEQLAHADILPGWDAVAGTGDVVTDEAGHGTAVCRIICGEGYGVSQGATLLPVRITGDGKKIKTSHLVESLYYAADAGADVINMSFGGYIENAAESEAVAYAVSKGCVLVASAGNEGADPEYAGRYSYPASFDGVVSVASFGADGKLSAFSQYNDKVDICAPGEGLAVFAGTDAEDMPQGTSFSTAYVSAAAALCIEKRGERIDSKRFEKILEYAANGKRGEKDGWGNLYIPALLECADMPYVEGVRMNGAYFSEISARFQNCTALLDGEPYESGEIIFSQGRHTLTVTDARGEVTFEFYVDTLPLTFETEKGEGWVAFVFERGSATLDGKKYTSGTHITRRGDHVFELTGPYGNKVGTSFSISNSLPAVFGAAPDEVCTRPIEITAVGKGKTCLDGVEFEGSAYVYTNGKHTVKVTDITGETAREFTFTLDIAHSPLTGTVAEGGAFFDPEYGYAACWGPGGATLTLYALEDLTTPIREMTLPGEIVGVFAEDGLVCAVHSCGWRTFRRDDILFGEGDAGEYFAEDANISDACMLGGDVFFADESGSVFRGEDKKDMLSAGGRSVLLASAGEKVYAYSAYTPGIIYEYFSGAWKELELANEPGYFSLSASGSYVCVGGDVYKEDFGVSCFRVPESERLLACSGGYALTSAGVYDIVTAERTGAFPSLVSYYSVCGEYAAAVAPDGTYILSSSAYGFGAARPADAFAGDADPSDDFTLRAELAPDLRVCDAACGDSGYVFAAAKGDNRLYEIDPKTLELKSVTHLKYQPLKITPFGEGCAVVFERANCVYLTAAREYLEFPHTVSDICLCGGEIFAVSRGALLRTPASGGEVQEVALFENVRQIAAYKDMLCVLAGDEVSVYDPASGKVRGRVSAEFRRSFAVSDEYVFVGADAFRGETLEPVSNIGESPSCSRGGAAFGESGVYRVSDGERLSETPVYGVKCVITPAFELLIFGENSLASVSCTGDIANGLNIYGVSDGGVYYDTASFGCEMGILYLDGEVTENVSHTEKVGAHELRAALPFGISRTVTFRLLRNAQKIELPAAAIELAPGQSVQLSPRITPADAVCDIVYSSDSPAVAVDENGRVTAVEHGSAVITARVEGTGLYAQCGVTVARDTLVFAEGPYTADRRTGILSGVTAGTTAAELLSHIVNSENTFVFDLSGKEVKDGVLCTGMTVQKRSGGKVTDTLKIAVAGDADRDGNITVADVDILYRHLRGSRVQTGVVAAALDVNRNGKVTSADLKAIYPLVQRGKSPVSSNSIALRAPDFVSPGAVFPVYIDVSSLASGTVGGVLKYDKNALQYDRMTENLSEICTGRSNGEVEFIAPAVERAGGDIICVYLRAAEDAQNAELRLGDISAYCDGELVSLADAVVSVPVRAPGAALEVKCQNAELEFDPSVHSYSLTVPYGENKLELEISAPAECFVFTSPAVLADEGVTAVTLTYVTPAETLVYVFNAEHGEKREPDGDSTLGAITVTGAELEPAFSPRINEYSVRAPQGVTVTVSAHANSKYASVETRTVYGEDGIIYTFVCTSETGAVTEYTVTVITREKPEESSSPAPEQSEEPSAAEESSAPAEESSVQEEPSAPEESQPSEEEQKEKGGVAVWLPVAIAAFAAAICVAVLLLRRRARNK
ncbi:MAG: S8 family serine peptidase [Clostridia bacterium]|nr:S8 family serine peptidase [Clostridia bacterium]